VRRSWSSAQVLSSCSEFGRQRRNEPSRKGLSCRPCQNRTTFVTTTKIVARPNLSIASKRNTILSTTVDACTTSRSSFQRMERLETSRAPPKPQLIALWEYRIRPLVKQSQPSSTQGFWVDTTLFGASGGSVAHARRILAWLELNSRANEKPKARCIAISEKTFLFSVLRCNALDAITSRRSLTNRHAPSNPSIQPQSNQPRTARSCCI
jgi:hypothetical protein